MYTWDKDDSIPAGWKSRFWSSKTYFLSPESEQFQSRVAILTNLSSLGYPEEDLEKVRSSLSVDGWQENDLLPTGWRFKRGSGSKPLTAEDFQINCFESALVYTESKPEAFSVEETEALKLFQGNQSAQARSVKYYWNEDDKSVPAGWKCRWGGPRMYFLSPEGLQFPSRAAVLQFMIQQSSQQQLVEEVRGLAFQYEVWSSHHLLHHGWIYKHEISDHTNKSNWTKVLFVISCGETFKSFLSATKFTEVSGYTEDQINNLNTMMMELTTEGRNI